MNKKYDLAIYIGRFQPFHNGHLHSLEEASKLANHIMVLVGSYQRPPTPKNPFSFENRHKMIQDTLAWGRNQTPVEVHRLHDHMYNDAKWITDVQHIVRAHTDNSFVKNPRVAIVGHDKDESSYYLKMFPQWDFVDVGSATDHPVLDATKIRQLVFEDSLMYVQSVVPPPVYQFLSLWSATDEYKQLREEYDYIKRYKASWASAPFPPIFVTTDAVVVQSGHLLVVKRGHSPGKGLFALPGGFLNQNERMEDGMLRELEEETNIKLQTDVLRRCIKHREVFDDPNRSQRGRTVTQAFLIHLDDSKPLAKVKGGDDAAEALWMSFEDLRRSRELFFEDHWFIASHMIEKG